MTYVWYFGHDAENGQLSAKGILEALGRNLFESERGVRSTANLKAYNVLVSARTYLQTGQTGSSGMGNPSLYADYFFRPEMESDMEMERRTR